MVAYLLGGRGGGDAEYAMPLFWRSWRLLGLVLLLGAARNEIYWVRGLHCNSCSPHVMVSCGLGYMAQLCPVGHELRVQAQRI